MGLHTHKLIKDGARYRPTTVCGVSKTKQEFRKECDINFIVKRYNATGQLPVDMAKVQPVFADVSRMGSFAEALNQVRAAEEAFMMLPPELRTKFDNDPAALVSFIQDDKNYNEAVSLGLVAKPTEPTQAPAEGSGTPIPPKA